MKTDRLTKILLSVVALLLILNLLTSLLTTGPAQAEENHVTGRYEISAWAAASGSLGHHSGYYVIDTMTGKVVDMHHEVHGPNK